MEQVNALVVQIMAQFLAIVLRPIALTIRMLYMNHVWAAM